MSAVAQFAGGVRFLRVVESLQTSEERNND